MQCEIEVCQTNENKNKFQTEGTTQPKAQNQSTKAVYLQNIRIFKENQNIEIRKHEREEKRNV
jgi:hypothetical protein